MQNKPNLILTFATIHKPTDNSSPTGHAQEAPLTYHPEASLLTKAINEKQK